MQSTYSRSGCMFALSMQYDTLMFCPFQICSGSSKVLLVEAKFGVAVV